MSLQNFILISLLLVSPLSFADFDPEESSANLLTQKIQDDQTSLSSGAKTLSVALADPKSDLVADKVVDKLAEKTISNKLSDKTSKDGLIRRHGGVQLQGFYFRLHNGTKEVKALEFAENLLQKKVTTVPAAHSLLIESKKYSQILVQGPTEIKILEFNEKVISLSLLSGSMQFQFKDSESFKIKVKTILWEQTFDEGAMALSWDAGLGTLKWINIAPGRALQIKDRIEKQQLESLQKMSFNGRVEDGQIVYDLLLNGNKTPRGTFSASAPVEAEEKKQVLEGVEAIFPSIFYTEQDMHEEKLKKNLRKASKLPGFSDFLKESDVKKLQRQKAKTKGKNQGAFKGYNFKEAPPEVVNIPPGFVCSKPLGKFNECVWQKEKKDCVRRRCFADGRWNDPFILKPAASDIFCGQKPKVGPCDY